MTATSDRSSERDAVLADLHDMLAEAGRGDVVAFAAAHPQYRSELLAFATEWIALAPSTEDDAEDRAPPDIPSASVRAALERFVSLKPSPLETREKLEQLRALEAGMRIDVEIINTVPLGVDTPEDLERARQILS